VRDAIRLEHHVYSTEKTTAYWIQRFIFYEDNRHPAEMDEREIGEPLMALPVEKNVAAPSEDPRAHRSAVSVLWGLAHGSGPVQAIRVVPDGRLPHTRSTHTQHLLIVLSPQQSVNGTTVIGTIIFQ
jgi:hypothetical protein